MNTAHELLTQYQVRKTKKQKRAFIRYATEKANALGYRSVSVEKGKWKSENIVVGNVGSAKVVFTAHYDTCPVLPFPNFITPKNIWLYLLYQVGLSVFLIALMGAVSLAVLRLLLLVGGTGPVWDILIDFLPMIASLSVLFILLMGPANRHTANDNTSGVLTLFEIMAALPEERRAEVAFVFFDLEEMGMLGSASFASRHKNAMRGKLLVNFDCVSDGKEVLLYVKKQARGFVPLLERAFAHDGTMRVEVATKGVIYPSDQMMFPCGVGVATFKKTKGGLLYMNRIHTPRDVIFEEENIRFLTKGALALCEILAKE